MTRDEITKRGHIPGVLKLVGALLLLRWVLHMHHGGSGGPGWERIHQRWHEHEARLKASRGSPDLGPDAGSSATTA